MMQDDDKPEARTFGELLRDGATSEPDRPAVFYHDEVLSYGELYRQSKMAAQALLALGIRRGDKVGVWLGNQPEWLVMCFAAAHVGATFVPLNTWYKVSELDWTLRHCELTVLVTSPGFLKQDLAGMLRELIPELGTGSLLARRSSRFPALRHVIWLGETEGGMEGWEDFLRRGQTVDEGTWVSAVGQVRADDVLFILYTSGSTAEPKGVQLNHWGVVGNARGMAERRDIRQNDRIWLGAPLFYGLGATNALPVAITSGAALVLQDSFDAGTAIRLIELTRATAYYGTGNMTRAILDHPSFRPERVASLSKGNAGTTREYKRMTLVELGVTRASPAYGLTESYGNAVVGLADDPLETKLDTSGTALPGTELRIVDPQTFQPVPAGEVGLVLLRGYVTPGYHANPAETARALRADGFFDTGDLGSVDENGRFVFHARLKEVIKSGGINVSPLEVENLLVEHPDIYDAHVVGVADPVRGERIVAFVCTRRPLKEAAVRDFVKSRAASFKAPHAVFFRTEEQLPRLASGKVAKHRLIEEAERLS